MKNALIRVANCLQTLGVDPYRVLCNIKALPFFVQNYREYQRLNQRPGFAIETKRLAYYSADRFLNAGELDRQYFLQDVWASSLLFGRGVQQHVDVASRLDGFVAQMLPFCKVTYIDIRPGPVAHPNLTYLRGSVTEMPFKSETVSSLSCLHVIEHIGLGRYGDRVDPTGDMQACGELKRVLKKGGVLVVGVPVGREELHFDAHRIYDPATVVQMFDGLTLKEFQLIEDNGREIKGDPDFTLARRCRYGCGLFVFEKE